MIPMRLLADRPHERMTLCRTWRGAAVAEPIPVFAMPTPHRARALVVRGTLLRMTDLRSRPAYLRVAVPADPPRPDTFCPPFRSTASPHPTRHAAWSASALATLGRRCSRSTSFVLAALRALHVDHSRTRRPNRQLRSHHAAEHPSQQARDEGRGSMQTRLKSRNQNPLDGPFHLSEAVALSLIHISEPTRPY